MRRTTIGEKPKMDTFTIWIGALVLSLSSVTIYAEEAEIVDGFRTVEWTELIPQADLDALLNPPDELLDIVDGSEEDMISNQLKSRPDSAALEESIPSEQSEQARLYQSALISTRVVPEYQGQKIRIAGFVVPLTFGEGPQDVVQFFLVPYFGACIHVPPPPPNQIIYARYPKGFTLESLSQPFWLFGTLETTVVENDTATSAYSITVEKVEPYDLYNG